MALPYHALKRLEPLMRGARILSLGYPDLMCSADEIEKLFGYKPTKFTDAHEWHKVKNPFPETIELFEAIGAKAMIVDFTAERGIEKIADLNHPHDLGKFDLVIDPGTLEHCFNIGQAFLNAANAVRQGGNIFHISPMTMLNHAFWSLNPTTFHDFYGQNGWTITELKVLPVAAPFVSSTERFDMHTEYLIRCLARRDTNRPLRWPIQTKYLKKMASRHAAPSSSGFDIGNSSATATDGARNRAHGFP